MKPGGIRSALIAGLMLVGAPILAQAQVSLTTVVQMAERNSPAVRIAEANVRKAEAGLSQSKDVVIPSLHFNTGLPVFPEVGFTGTPPSIWSATIQSLVFGVPQKRYIDSARLALEAATTNLHSEGEQVALQASTDYIELDAVNEEIAAARQQQIYAAKLVEIERQRTEAGVDPLSDYLQAKLTAAQIHLNELHLETRAVTLSKELANLTGLPTGSITPDHASIPQIPKIDGNLPSQPPHSVTAAELLARSKQQAARGDEEVSYFPQLTFGVQYNRNTTLLNDVNSFFARPLPANNFSSGVAIQIPLFDMFNRAKARESAAEALRATIEAEAAAKQNQVQIATLTNSLRELRTEEEIASLKEQIAQEHLKAVLAQTELGNGAVGQPGAPPQLSPKAEQLAQIEERQRYEDSLEASLSLSKARLDLLCALGHMQDWLNELQTK